MVVVVVVGKSIGEQRVRFVVVVGMDDEGVVWMMDDGENEDVEIVGKKKWWRHLMTRQPHCCSCYWSYNTALEQIVDCTFVVAVAVAVVAAVVVVVVERKMKKSSSERSHLFEQESYCCV